MLSKKIIAIAVFVFLGYAIENQNNIITTSVQYKVRYTNNNKTLVDDICQLDITKTQSYFYSLGFIEQIKLVTAKMQNAKATGGQMNFEYGEIKTNLCQFNVIKNYQNNRAIVSERINGQNLAFVKDSLNTNKWTILNETKKINNLMCQKAVCVKDKVNITVWFCKSVPLTEGPFYYYGLPGLIVMASNSLGWEANLISIKYHNSLKDEIYIEPYKLVTEAAVAKAKANNKPKINNDVITLPNGTKLTKTEN